MPLPVALAALHLPEGAEWAAPAMGYLLGAVPFGWLLAKLVRGVDLRTVGSGNIGATNAGRTLGRPLGLLAFLLDFAKGWVPVALLAPALAAAPERALSLSVLSGVAAGVGHCYPVTLGFRGGKAVATWCGAVIALDPALFLWGGGVWIVAVALFRYVGLASLLMVATFAVAALARGSAEVAWGAAAMTVLIAARHRANIERMLKGVEPRFGESRNESENDTGEEPREEPGGAPR